MAGVPNRHSQLRNHRYSPAPFANDIQHRSCCLPGSKRATNLKQNQRHRDGCTSPNRVEFGSSLGTPVYSIHWRLKYSGVPSGPHVQTSCGRDSTTTRYRSSLSVSCVHAGPTRSLPRNRAQSRRFRKVATIPYKNREGGDTHGRQTVRFRKLYRRGRSTVPAIESSRQRRTSSTAGSRPPGHYAARSG